MQIRKALYNQRLSKERINEKNVTYNANKLRPMDHITHMSSYVLFQTEELNY